MKITGKNKSALQFIFSNPHVFERVPAVDGITFEDAEAVKAKLQKAYGADWFRFFLALKPATLNAKIGA